MSEDTYNKILDFLKQLRNNLLFEADKKIKALDAELDNLLKRIQEVQRNNTELNAVLNSAQNPNDKARTALINELLKEGAKDDSILDSLRNFVTASKQSLGNLKEDLKKASSTKDIESIISKLDSLSKEVAAKRKETEDTNERVEERRK